MRHICLIMLTVALAGLSALYALAPSGAGAAAQNNAAQAGDARYAGVIFYADWCSACKVLDPRIDAARRDDSAQALEFFVFDMTDSASIESARKLAAAEGLEPVLQQYGAVTGFMVIYDRRERKILQTVTSAFAAEEIAALFRKLAVSGAAS